MSVTGKLTVRQALQLAAERGADATVNDAVSENAHRILDLFVDLHAQLLREREVQLSVWANIPPDVARAVAVTGDAGWGRTAPMSATEIGQLVAQSVHTTEEFFSQPPGPKELIWLASTRDSDTVIAFVGTGPNSPLIAQALSGAWNLLRQHCLTAQGESP